MRSIKYVGFVAMAVGCMVVAHLSLAQEFSPQRPHPSVFPDVEKPHSDCKGVEYWDDCTDQGYENTSTQAASANVIYTLCSFWCFASVQEIYHDMVGYTGNVGQFPEEQRQTLLGWTADNCPLCSLAVRIAHKGYADQDPVNPEEVTFEWADRGIPYTEHVTIWVVSKVELPFPPAPTGRQDLSQQLTYLGTLGRQVLVHDSDCDKNCQCNNLYRIGSDENGEYLEDYFGPGQDGYLQGVVFISGRP
ncbi:MAG: hypothetical protein WCE90_04570 [Candidatus Zixiibacteriota bacterium]